MRGWAGLHSAAEADLQACCRPTARPPDVRPHALAKTQRRHPQEPTGTHTPPPRSMICDWRRPGESTKRATEECVLRYRWASFPLNGIRQPDHHVIGSRAGPRPSEEHQVTLLRISIAAAGAALALGGGAALAAPALMNNDAHGDQVSAAAHSCPRHASSDRDSHGDCVSKVATGNARSGSGSSTTDRDKHGDLASAAARSAGRGNGGVASQASGTNGTNNDLHGDAVSTAAHTCPFGTPADRDGHGDCVASVAKAHK